MYVNRIRAFKKFIKTVTKISFKKIFKIKK